MAHAHQPSMAELIARRRRFIGRGAELSTYRENFGYPPEDERHRYLFHVHGNAGVGKTSLVREMERAARECGALTAYVDESVSSVPEALAAIAEHLGRQGHPLKQLDRQLATYRQRRHEAESAAVSGAGTAGAAAAGGESPAGSAAAAPSAGSTAAVTAGVIGLRMVPVVGAFADAVDTQQLAAGADRLRATLSARFRNQEDVQLVLRPDQVLTPVLVTELTEIARSVPWIALFFDTYERTAPFLDSWLRDLMTTSTYGRFPGAVVVTVAGQRPFGAARWGEFADFVTDLPLAPFTEGETRTLLAAKRVTDESVVEEVLRLSGGLPVLVSTLAENQPTDPYDVGDPSATAVERFLKWEQDPVRRAAALACALPRRLDEDVFRAVVTEDAAGLYDWLRALPFATLKDAGVSYHGVVRAPMLRLQRTRSPRRWRERHTALAACFARWRAETETELRADTETEPPAGTETELRADTETEPPAGTETELRADEVWESAEWRALRFEETYHTLCAGPRGALPGALRDVVDGCRESPAAARRAAQVLAEGGADTDDEPAREWGRRLAAALDDEEEGVRAALGLLLDRPGLDTRGRAAAHTVRGRELREAGGYEQALAEYDRSLALDQDEPLAHYGRGLTHQLNGAYEAALADLRRADELAPETTWILESYGETLRLHGRHQDAADLLDRVLALDPTNAYALASRGVAQQALGRHAAALADLDRALELDVEYLWALVRRARLLRETGETDRSFADLDRAVELAPDKAWIASERGEAYRLADRNDDAERELTRTLELDADHASALASRGCVRTLLGRHAEARADLDRAIELDPEYAWALAHRAGLRQELDDATGALADLERAVAADPDVVWIRRRRGEARLDAGQHEEAVADLTEVLNRRPDDVWALTLRGSAHHARGRYGHAFADLDRSLELDQDGSWAYYCRARTAQAAGRPEQAYADLVRCVDLYPDADHARRRAAAMCLLLGRPEEALRRLDELISADADDLDDRCEALRHSGQWAAALAVAERYSVEDPVYGTLQRAMVVTVAEGAEAGAPVWRELERLLSEAEDLTVEMPMYGAMLSEAVRGDWEALDASLTTLFALEHEWDDLAHMACDLEELLHAPGVDAGRLSPRLARVVAARDAFAARWA
ncbi:tetratricopeptide repeat protein [Streptomyces sp. NPDC102274]|uniref:tetratricopeptide repeat protein n=1 Tax=Streptomyces sp. NPDC102274 TaxID=3366151 RepID=UPI003803E98C